MVHMALKNEEGGWILKKKWEEILAIFVARLNIEYRKREFESKIFALRYQVIISSLTETRKKVKRIYTE